ncbi:MAG: AAA family ATPase [Firmicutes bacterium]|nr:AAA family ATPase [Bacillota bacterium]
MIRCLTMENYRSVREQTVRFHPYTVVVGPNAAGKSNLLSALVFLNHLVTYGLDSAVLYQRGWASIVNRRIWKMRDPAAAPPPTRLAVELEPPVRLYLPGDLPPGGIFPEAETVRYEVAVHFADTGLGPDGVPWTPERVVERVTLAGLRHLPTVSDPSASVLIVQETQFGLPSQGVREVRITIREGQEWLPDAQRQVIEAMPPREHHPEFSPYAWLIGRLSWLVPDLFTAIRGIMLFDLQPLWMHGASQPVPYPQLNPYGGNLPQRLDQIFQAAADRDEFEALLRMITPWVDHVRIFRQPDHSFLLAGLERFDRQADNVQMESYTLSDGTLYTMALIAALHFEDVPVKLLEEPERYLHPAVFPIVAEWFADVTDSRHKLLLTTHSPDLIAALPVDHWDHIVYTYRTTEGDTCFQAVDPARLSESVLWGQLQDPRVLQRLDLWYQGSH